VLRRPIETTALIGTYAITLDPAFGSALTPAQTSTLAVDSGKVLTYCASHSPGSQQ